ncbi:MAG: type II toxin-antitoxin system PemK/MazF family toxin [Cetobacterium sp.]|uniref:type II toxin-antitoxin system PemK/MazF family toxin n=1 Tax=Cetobacterium sp. TaxID=2071632 RepID=UPI003EE5B569
MIALSKVSDFLGWLNKKIILNTLASKAQKRIIKRGQVYYCQLGVGVGSEEGKERPCVILQNDSGNAVSGNTIIAPITNGGACKSVCVPIKGNYNYTDKDGVQTNLTGNVLLGNITTVSKARLGDYITTIKVEMEEIDNKILTSLGLFSKVKKLNDTRIKDKQFIKDLLSEKKNFTEEITKLNEKIKKLENQLKK